MRCAAVVLFATLVASPAFAEGDWVYESGDPDDAAGRRVRFALNINIWRGTFNRPPSACRPTTGFEDGEDIGFAASRALRPAQFPPFAFCNNERASETAAGPGIDVQFRAFGPLYVTVGLDLFYTEPDSFALTNQWVIAVPFGLRLTWPHWTLRPIAEALITPVLYVTDDGRDYTLGGRGGLAYRLGSFGDLSLLVGYQTAETLDNVSITLGLQPIL